MGFKQQELLSSEETICSFLSCYHHCSDCFPQTFKAQMDGRRNPPPLHPADELDWKARHLMQELLTFLHNQEPIQIFRSVLTNTGNKSNVFPKYLIILSVSEAYSTRVTTLGFI